MCMREQACSCADWRAVSPDPSPLLTPRVVPRMTMNMTDNTQVSVAAPADDGDFQTYRTKSSRKRKADQMDVDVEADADSKKKVQFQGITSQETGKQVSVQVSVIASTSDLPL